MPGHNGEADNGNDPSLARILIRQRNVTGPRDAGSSARTDQPEAFGSIRQQRCSLCGEERQVHAREETVRPMVQTHDSARGPDRSGAGRGRQF